VEMIRLAHELDLLTAPYVFTPEEARAMAQAGADVLVPHMGLTTKGAIGAQMAIGLDEAVRRVQSMHDAAKEIKPDVLVLCHGGHSRSHAELLQGLLVPCGHERKKRLGDTPKLPHRGGRP